MDKDIYQEIYQIHNSLVSDFESTHNKMREMYRNSKGDLWSSAEKSILEKEGRPSPEYALLEPVRNSLIGTERMSRASMRCVPYKDNENGEIANALTTALYFNYNRAWYNWHKSKQFMHVITCGIGFSADWWDMTKKHWRFKAIDPLRVYFDKSTRDATFEDCRYIQTVEYYTAEEIIGLALDDQTRGEIIKRMKHYEPQLSNKLYKKLLQLGYDSWEELGSINQNYSIGITHPSVTDKDTLLGRYKVIEHHECRPITKIYLINKDTKNTFDVSQVNPKAVREFLAKRQNYEKLTVTESKYYVTIICPAIDMVISDKPYPYDASSFMIKPQVAYDVFPYIKDSYSVLENPAKINKAFNKKKAIELEYAINTTGGDWIADEASVAGLEDEWRTRKKMILRRYRSGTTPPRRDQPATPPATLFQTKAEELNLFDFTAPVSKPYRGMQEGANETGVLFSYKIKQNEIMLQHLFDNATLSQYLDAKSCVEQIIAFQDDETWARLLEDDNMELLDEIREQKFEIELDQSKPSVTARQYGFAQLIQILPYIPPQLIRFDTVIEASDIPNKEEIAEFIREQYRKQGMLETPQTLSPNALMEKPEIQTQEQGMKTLPQTEEVA